MKLSYLFSLFRTHIKRMDFKLTAATSFLSLLSIITILGGYANFGIKRVIVQIIAVLLGFILMIVVSTLDYNFIAKKLGLVLYGVCAILMLVAIVTGDGNNKSWIHIPLLPFDIQPSEFGKAAFLLTFGYHLSKVKDTINKPKTLLLLLIHAGAYIGIILLSGDLGVALVYMGITAVMLYGAGLSPWYFLGAVGIIGASSPVIWSLLREDQQQRILIGFNPDLDPLDKGFQAIKSRSAIANGGFFGSGLFGGEVYETYNASHTDFIFSTFCEKFGFLGGILVIALFAYIIIRVLKLSRMYRADSGTYICMGFAGMMIVQIVENIGMCLGMLPVVGITLPYMSYGGSSMLAIYIMTGLVQSVGVYRRKSRIYFSDQS